MNEIEQKVLEVLEDLCMTTVEDASKKLIGDLAMDSLRMVMLLVTLEEVFSIELDESDLNPFLLITVQDVIDLASKYTQSEEESVNE
jgi:acyl carrier protein